jgi:hypothetical protein
MKRNLFTSALLLISAVIFSAPFELGIEFGYPTGLSAKLWTSNRAAFDFGLGFTNDGWDNRYDDRYDNRNRIHLTVDYQLHRFDLISVDAGRLGLYYGLGLMIVSANDTALGLRIPLGAQYDFPSAPIAIFLEFAPVLSIPDVNLGIDTSLGIRYVFGKRSGGSGKSKSKSGKKANKDPDDDEEKPKVKLQW